MIKFNDWILLNEAPLPSPGGLASPAGLPPGGPSSPGMPPGGLGPPPMSGGSSMGGLGGGGLGPPPMGGPGAAPTGPSQPVMKIKSPNVWDVLEQLLGMKEKK